MNTQKQKNKHRMIAGLKKVLSHALIITVGSFFFVPFVWMLVTSFKADQDVFRNPPTWLPHDNVYFDHNGEDLKMYAVTDENGENPRDLALVSIDSGKGTFINPVNPDEVIVSRMKFAEEILKIGIRWQNYPDALNRSTRPGLDVTFWTYFKNSLIVAGLTIVGTVLSNAPVAYGFSKIKWPGRNVVFILVLATMMLPFQVTMIPLYQFFNDVLHWGDSFLPLIVPAFFANAYDVFLFRQYFRTIPDEISDAARVDGANDWQIFTKLILPLSKPIIATVSVFTFLYAWNDFQGPLLYLVSPKNFTLALGLQDFQGQHSVIWNQLMAASVVFTVPIIIAFFFAQRTFIQGIKLTGSKG
jgi:multiple sugar transport system permease protein